MKDFDLSITLFSCIMNVFFLRIVEKEKTAEYEKRERDKKGRGVGVNGGGHDATAVFNSQLVSNRHSECSVTREGGVKRLLCLPHCLLLAIAGFVIEV